MTTAQFEKRLTALEQEMAELRSRLSAGVAGPNSWVEEVAATFSGPRERAAFDEAMRLGRNWRKRQRNGMPKRREVRRK